MAPKLYTFTCQKCGKTSRRKLSYAPGRKATICESCRIEHERVYQRDYARRKAAEKRAT